jgi:hypothetical protein
MPAESGDDSGHDADATRFARELNSLKRRGSALLVVGTVPDEMYERASRQMLGDERAADPRRRLVVSDDPSVGERLSWTGPTTPEYARVVARETSARSTATAAASAGASDPTLGATGAAKVHNVDSSLDELGATLTDIVEQFDAAAGGLAAAELRVAFDCLSTLLAQYDEQTVFRFLHVLTNQVRGRKGMAHFRLPKPVDAQSVRALEPLFDAVIELRVDGGELQQRWHFVERPFVSEWLNVPE